MTSSKELVISETAFQAGPCGISPGNRFRSITISVVTSVLAFCLKAVLGKRIAPSKSACCETYSRTAPSSLSNVPLEVTKRISPPGRTFSSDEAKK